MSTATARFVALPFALLALGLRVLDTFWITPLTWRIDAWQPALAAWMATLIASVGLPLAGYLLLTRRARRRAETWRIETGGPAQARFVASAAPRWTGPCAILLGWMAGSGLITERVPGGDRMRMATFGYALPVSILLVGMTVIVTVALTISDRPRLTMDRDAVTVRHHLGRLRLTWGELIPGGPPPPAKRNPDTITINRMLHGVATPVRLPAGRMQVAPAFLAHTLRHYTEHPEQRGGIGTEAGLTELRSTFRADQGGPA